MSFPVSPTNGQIATINGIRYVYSSTANSWTRISNAKYTAAASAPSNPANGDQWYNTQSDILFEYLNDGLNNYWVDINGTSFIQDISNDSLITGNLSVGQVSNAQAYSTSTGALKVTGGASLTTGNLYIGGSGGNAIVATGNVFVTGVVGIHYGQANITVGNVSSNTQASSTTTGALTIVGGTSIATGNLYIGGSGGNAIVATGSAHIAGSLLPSGTASGSQNIGAVNNAWNTVYAVATSALYADLAENYISDADYEPGTVVVFGGAEEVTISTIPEDYRVAGIVSTKPAYLMNAQKGNCSVALTGRVPCLVRGPVSKGDLLTTSNITGVAQVLNKDQYIPGCIIGKSIEEITDNSTQLIEVAVGRY